jgi:hypothetical protein
VEVLGDRADGGDEVEGWGLGKGEGFKAGIVSVGDVSFKSRFLGVHPGSMDVGCEDAENVEVI